MRKDYTISDLVKNAIIKAQNAGIKVLLATGRMYNITVPIAKELQLTSPLVTYQGSLVKEFYNSEKVLLHYDVPENLTNEVISESKGFELQTNIYLEDLMYVENESEILFEYSKKRNIKYNKLSSFRDLIGVKPTKILIMDSNPDKVTEITEHLQLKFQDKLNISKSTPYFCEIVNKDASKGNAILHLADMWGIKSSEIMTIGDHDNDKDMLKIAEYAIAMGNATEGLKEIATYVTDTVSNDGVAHAIEKFAF